MSSKVTKGLLAAAFLSVAGMAFSAPPTSAPAPTKPLFKFGTPKKMTPQEMESVIGAVTEVMRETYIDPERSGNNNVMTDIALKAIVGSLDPHSEYMTKKDVEEFMKSGDEDFTGIGIMIGPTKDKMPMIVDTFEDSPSEKAGIKPDDIILEINDEVITKNNIQRLVDAISGKAGTSIKLLIKRPGVEKPIPFEVVRADIKRSSIKTASIGNDIAFIRLTNFMKVDLTAEFEKAVTEINTKMGSSLSSYIIDLRDNPGGKLDDAANIAADLLNTDKTIVSTRGRAPENNAEMNGTMEGHKIVDLTHGKPIVVLVNKNSASASEVLSGALQDLAPDRVTIIGETTFGKGLVQKILPLQSPEFAEIFEKHGITTEKIPVAAIKVTVSYYFTPSGRSIHNVGVTPNIRFIPNVTANDEEPETEQRSEATLPSGLSRPGDASPDETKTTQSCTAKAGVDISYGYDRVLKDKYGQVAPVIRCAIEKLRGLNEWTNIGPYTPPAVKAPAPSPSS